MCGKHDTVFVEKVTSEIGIISSVRTDLLVSLRLQNYLRICVLYTVTNAI